MPTNKNTLAESATCVEHVHSSDLRDLQLHRGGVCQVNGDLLSFLPQATTLGSQSLTHGAKYDSMFGE